MDDINEIHILPKYKVLKYKPGKRTKKTWTNKQYDEELKSKNPNIKRLGHYVNQNYPIKHQCLICYTIWIGTPSNALHKIGCPNCVEKQRRISHTNSHSVYLERLSKINPNIIPLEQYQKYNIPIKHQCLICNTIWLVCPNNTINGQDCPNCTMNRMRLKRRKSQEQYENELRIYNPNILCCGEYVNAITPILHRYNNCGHEAIITPEAALMGSNCRKCSAIEHGINSRISSSEFIERVNKNNPTLIILSEYNGMDKHIEVECSICNYIWSPYANAISRDKNPSGCPKCASSQGEKRIKNFLDNNNIKYISQMKFEELIGIGGRKLSYDFYLIDYNILIEFNGMQHMESVDYFGGEKAFKKQQEHDKRKREYAEKHNINLLEIWYYEVDKTEEILINYLNLKSVTTAECA